MRTRRGIVDALGTFVLLLNVACEKVVPESPSDGGLDPSSSKGDAAAGECNDRSDCRSPNDSCGYAVDAGCSAPRVCLRESSPVSLHCACDGRDTLAGDVATEPVAHGGSCRDPNFNCDFVYKSPAGDFVDDCTKESCPSGYICLVEPSTVVDVPALYRCLKAPSQCAERPTCECVTPCACKPEECSEADVGVLCKTLR